MKCTHPIVSVWWRPGVDATSFERLGFKLERPLLLSKYSQVYGELKSPSLALHWPKGMDDYLRYILLPCGRCLSCRLNKSQEWVFRCLAEARYHEKTSFITLTVSPDKESEVFPRVNGHLSLSYLPFQDFMKRFRDRISPVEIRFLMCGEYGEQFERPHYHALIFGYDFPDRKLFKLSPEGYPIYISPLLSDLWKFGFSTVMDMCEPCIQYVCRYTLKKVTGATAEGYYEGRMPEFIRMSNRPGIGQKYFSEYIGRDFYKRGCDNVFFRDFVTLREHKIRPPRYYDKLFQASHSGDFVMLSDQRYKSGADDMFRASCADLEELDTYLKNVTQGRTKKGAQNV